jgi:hypothetical protein
LCFLVKVGVLGVIIVFMVGINVFQILQLVFLGVGSTIVVVICIFLLIVGNLVGFGAFMVVVHLSQMIVGVLVDIIG